jgi:serine/threonine protein phosphatase 1
VKTWVIGDIHGRYYALKEVLLESNFDFEDDCLITLGDICDGGMETNKCFNLLLQIRNRIDVVGNHDLWFLNWAKGGIELPLWTHQGGLDTIQSYDFDRENVPRAHRELIENALLYYIDKKNNIFVHGGFNPLVPIENQTTEFITWDRTLIQYARHNVIRGYKHVFVGHTTTQAIKPGVFTPITMHNLTMCDCGGGWMGRLAMVNVNTLEYVVSGKQAPRYKPDDGSNDTEEMAWGVELKKPNMKDPFW